VLSPPTDGEFDKICLHLKDIKAQQQHAMLLRCYALKKRAAAHHPVQAMISYQPANQHFNQSMHSRARQI